MGTINDVFSKWEDDDWIHIQEDPQTLKSFLRKFGFDNQLQKFDDNLEAVRKHKIKEDVHKEMIKRFDKKLLQLSLSYHPDHISGAAEKMKAHNDQATINSIRTLILRLSEDFLRDIDIDYRYEYYAYIDISSIGNEEDVNKLNLNLQYQLIMLSEMKREKIIANIKKFLMSCEGSLDSYYENDKRNFVLNFNLALSRLKECILWYRAITREFINVEKECAKDQKMENTLWTVKKMAADFESQLKILEKIKEVAKQALEGNFFIYADNEIMDSYFVLPFAKYINVLNMCNVMIGNTKQNWRSTNIFKRNLDFFQFYGDDKENFLKAYCLASYSDNPNSSNENHVREILKARFIGDNLMFYCKHNFDSTIHAIREKLKEEFNVEKHYIVRSVKKRTEEYNREVQDFHDGMLRRKKSNLLVLKDGQEKNGTDEKGNTMCLSQVIRHEKNVSKLPARKGDSNEDFKGIEGEKELLKKIRDNFKERSEKLKTKILQSDIANKKLREALEIDKKEEKLLLKKLGKVSSKNNKKLIDEVIEREEINRKLRDEIEKKREEERFLILTLCDNYEKISSFFEDEIIEIQTKVPVGDIANENRNLEISEKESCYQKEKNDFEEDINTEESLIVEGNQTSVNEMERNWAGTEDFDLMKHQTSEQKFENESMYDASKLNHQSTFQMLGTEENYTKITENHKITKYRHFLELHNQHAIQSSDEVNRDLRIAENDVRNIKLVQETSKESESFDTSGNKINKVLCLQKHEDYVKHQPNTSEFKRKSTGFKNLEKFNQTATKKGAVDGFRIQEKRCKKTGNAKEGGELQKGCGYPDTSEEIIKSVGCTNNFEETEIMKICSSDGSTERKALTSFDKDIKLDANSIEYKLRIKDSEEQEYGLENETSYETFEKEQEKGRDMLEALRNLKQSCKLMNQQQNNVNIDEKN